MPASDGQPLPEWEHIKPHAQNWLRQYTIHAQVKEVRSHTEMIDVTSSFGGPYHSQVPGPTSYWVLDTHGQQWDVDEATVVNWLKWATEDQYGGEHYTCMWCGRSYHSEAVRDFHESLC